MFTFTIWLDIHLYPGRLDKHCWCL